MKTRRVSTSTRQAASRSRSPSKAAIGCSPTMSCGACCRRPKPMPYPFGPFFLVCALTGQRRDEVAGMRWSEIDAAGELWTIPRGRMKRDRATGRARPDGRAGRHSHPAADRGTGSGFLHHRPDPDQWLLACQNSARQKDHPSATRRGDECSGWIEWAQKLCAPWRLHDLRRTLASGMARLGSHFARHRKGARARERFVRGYRRCLISATATSMRKRRRLRLGAVTVGRSCAGEPRLPYFSNRGAALCQRLSTGRK